MRSCIMTSDEKTIIPSLINYINSDLFTLGNISSSVKLTIPNDTDNSSTSWESVVSYLPLKFYRLIESYQDIYSIEKFDKKYIRNPKMCAYERYGSTNMWRPLMILNRCPTINRFNFEFIRYYDITKFTSIVSVLMSRVQNDE